MTLNPDDIARRTFATEARGYDRDEVRTFLFEVAAAMRLALHGTPTALVPFERPAPAPAPVVEPGGAFLMELAVEPALTPTPPAPQAETAPQAEAAPPTATEPEPEHTTATATADAHTDADDRAQLEAETFTQLGTEVAEVFRAAHDAVALIHDQAELDAQDIRTRAEADADEIRQRAETEGAWHLDRAKRVLTAAQEQAEGIIGEAEAQARAVLTSARDQAEEHAAQVASRARHHAEQILRAERESLRRLHEAHAHVAEAIDTLVDADSRPVVDLTDLRPNVRFGPVTVDMDDDRAPAPSELTVQDPVARMVRAAVGRAVTGAAEHAGEILDGETDLPAAPPTE